MQTKFLSEFLKGTKHLEDQAVDGWGEEIKCILKDSDYGVS
jgi:hypothetical protein